MRYVHNIRISVFLKPEEYASDAGLIQTIKNTFQKFLPLDFEKEKLSIKEEDVESFENRKIKIITLDITKEAHTNTFIKTLKGLLGTGQCKTILEQRWSRLDEELCFYIRLDKTSVLKDEYILTDGGDCVHIKMTIAAFPKNREKALKVVEEMFNI